MKFGIPVTRLSKKYGECFRHAERRSLRRLRRGAEVRRCSRGAVAPQSWGRSNTTLLGPAEYLTDEVNDAQADERYRRIHEQCAVLKFGKGDNWIMIPGDADRAAFENHITKYHGDRLKAVRIERLASWFADVLCGKRRETSHIWPAWKRLIRTT